MLEPVLHVSVISYTQVKKSQLGSEGRKGEGYNSLHLTSGWLNITFLHCSLPFKGTCIHAMESRVSFLKN